MDFFRCLCTSRSSIPKAQVVKARDDTAPIVTAQVVPSRVVSLLHFEDGVFTIKVGGVIQRFRAPILFKITAVSLSPITKKFEFILSIDEPYKFYRFESTDRTEVDAAHAFIEACLTGDCDATATMT